jgi:hypothetical protein
VAGAGDVNNDTYADVIVGCKYHDSNGRGMAGAAYVIFGGANLTTLDLFNFTSR